MVTIQPFSNLCQLYLACQIKVKSDIENHRYAESLKRDRTSARLVAWLIIYFHVKWNKNVAIRPLRGQ